METPNIISDQIVQLVKGEFTPSQASDIVLSLISQKISYHKLEEIQLWERNHEIDLEPLRNRITELENEKKKAENFIAQMKAAGKNLKIDGTIEMKSAK